MYKATNEFIKARDKFTGKFAVKHIPVVKRIGGGIANQCYTNSHNAKDEYSKGARRVVMISGWLVQPYHKETNSTAIIAHWWNADITGQHFDTTPLVDEGEQYVQDSALYQYCVENDLALSTHLAKSLLYQNDKFEVAMDFENVLFKPIDELRTEYLYDLIK